MRTRCLPIRSFASTDDIFLSHSHPDHASGLTSLLGIRHLIGKGPARVFAPAEIASAFRDWIAQSVRLYHAGFTATVIPVHADETFRLRGDLFVRAFRTHHRGPSLGYQFIRQVQKLRPEFLEVASRVRQALRAYRDGDGELALQVRDNDAQLDRQYTALFRELLTYMMEDPRNITPCTHLLFMAKNLERIGDHATNIAENVWFLLHGDQPLPPRDKRDGTSSTGAG